MKTELVFTALPLNIGNVTIPSTLIGGYPVISIGDVAFYNCDNLANTHYCGISTQWKNVYIGLVNQDLTFALHYNNEMSIVSCTEPAICQHEGCDYTKGEALGHNYSKYETTNATCTQDGGEGAYITLTDIPNFIQ